MDLFEYQGKQYFARYGIPTVPGAVADTVEEAVQQADALGYPVALKAQVQVGGRGKAGGIQVANNAEEARHHATNILGMDIKGHIVRRLWIEKAMDVANANEYYVSFTLDRTNKQHLGMLSAEGGVEIEEVAKTHPDAIAKRHINGMGMPDDKFWRDWIHEARLAPNAEAHLIDLLKKLYMCYIEGDAALAEINPLLVLKDGTAIALDAKVTLDDAGRPRHEEWEDYQTMQVLDEQEAAAKQYDLQYVRLEGSVGIIANGAGLAMATLDIVQEVGGAPANFLDIGGGANAQRVANALSVIDSDPHVKCIFINIFGGITRCDEVANGILQALKMVDIKAPIVLRLDGTNAAEGREILKPHESDKLIREETMLTAAQRAVALAGGN